VCGVQSVEQASLKLACATVLNNFASTVYLLKLVFETDPMPACLEEPQVFSACWFVRPITHFAPRMYLQMILRNLHWSATDLQMYIFLLGNLKL